VKAGADPITAETTTDAATTAADVTEADERSPEDGDKQNMGGV